MNPNKNEIESWILTLQAEGLAPDTIYLRRRHVDRALTHIGKHVSTMTADDLVSWFAAQEWKPATRRSYRVKLGLFFTWLAKTGRGEDLAAICFMMELMAYGGLRRGEVSRVHSRDLTGDWLQVTGKGGHIRLVPLPGWLCAKIRKAKGWAFPGQIDGHLSVPYVGKSVSRHLPDEITGYMLRHRYGTVTYKRSKDIRSVQALLGHAKLDTTMIYTQIDDASCKNAAALAWGLSTAA